jgi:hypothetical protein
VSRALQNLLTPKSTVEIVLALSQCFALNAGNDAPDAISARQARTEPGLPETTLSSLFQGVEAAQAGEEQDQDTADNDRGGNPWLGPGILYLLQAMTEVVLTIRIM